MLPHPELSVVTRTLGQDQQKWQQLISVNRDIMKLVPPHIVVVFILSSGISFISNIDAPLKDNIFLYSSYRSKLY